MRPNLIVISGQPGAGSTTTATLLSEYFSMNFFSVGRVYKDISQGKARAQHYFEDLKKICAGYSLSIPDLSMEKDCLAAANFWKTELGKSKAFHNALDELQLCLARRGGVVIEGKLAIYMTLKENIPTDLSLWLKAEESERAKRHSLMDSISYQKALSALQGRQCDERTEWKRIYNFDPWLQEQQAGLVIDTTHLTREDVRDTALAHLEKIRSF